MKDRQRMQQPIVGREVPDITQGLRIRCEIAVGEHRAFRAAGGSGRVEDRGKIIACPCNVGEVGEAFAALSVSVPSTLGSEASRRAGTPSSRPSLVISIDLLGIADEHRRFGISQEVPDLGWGIGCVERQVDGAGAERRQVKRQGFRRLFDLRGDAIARLDAELDERVREPSRAIEQIGIRQTAPSGRSRNTRERSFGKRAAKSVNRFSDMTILQSCMNVGNWAST